MTKQQLKHALEVEQSKNFMLEMTVRDLFSRLTTQTETLERYRNVIKQLVINIKEDLV